MAYFIESLGIWVPIILCSLLVILLLIFGYVKAPPDTAFIISGIRRRVIIGRAAIRIPIIERLDKLSLKLIPVDVKTSTAVPTADYINVTVDAAVNIKISDDEKLLNLAAQNFLNQDVLSICKMAREVLEGNMREIVGKMRLEEMVSNRQKFAELVKENALPDFAAMGLDIISFNVQNFTDNNGVIDDLGIDNISQIKKKAAIAKADADKEVAIAQSSADKQANDARIASQLEIAQKNNDLLIRQADLKKDADIKRAEADAAYHIQEQEQRKAIEIASANANIAAEEKAVELKRREAEVQEQALNATIRKKADADLYECERKADGELVQRQRNADAKKYEQEQEALAQRITAEANKYEQEQKAAGIEAIGAAEASAIEARGRAEAVAMEQKADAYAKYGQAAITEMLVNILPKIAEEVAKPLSQIDKITIFGGDNQSSLNGVAGNVSTLMAKTFDTVREATGIDLTEVVRASSYDAKVNRNLAMTGLPEAVSVDVTLPSETPEI